MRSMSSIEVVSLAAPSSWEMPKVKGSRFLADGAPAGDEAAALAFVDAVRAREPSATHHCWAFVLEGGRGRSSDDGEPGGTAGPPILRRIEGAGLSDVVVVVTRYYGGTNLGKGGLIRAYGGCAAGLLERAPTVTRPALVAFEVAHDYDLTGAVDGVLAAHDAITTAADYGVGAVRRVALPVGSADAFPDAVREATAGRVTPRRLD